MGCLEGCGVSIHGGIPNLSRHSSLQAAPADSPVSSEIGIDNVLRILPTPSVPRFVTLWLCAFIPEFQRSLTRGGCVVFPGRAGKPNSRLSWVTWSSTTVRVYHRLWECSKMSFLLQSTTCAANLWTGVLWSEWFMSMTQDLNENWFHLNINANTKYTGVQIYKEKKHLPGQLLMALSYTNKMTKGLKKKWQMSF